MENKIKHLDLIQGIINRMASNSFTLKGWAVTLVVGVLALGDKGRDSFYILIAYIPIVIFWGLDTYYLYQERLYRSLYDKVRKTEESNIDFSLKTTKEEFNYKGNSYFSCFISKTEFPFYIMLWLVCTGIIIITRVLK